MNENDRIYKAVNPPIADVDRFNRFVELSEEEQLDHWRKVVADRKAKREAKRRDG